MRGKIAVALTALVATLITVPQASAERAVQQWSIQGTAPVRVTLPAADAPRTAWARAGDGAWAQLAPICREGRVEFTLGAENLRGGSALVVLDPPEWLSLADAGPPAVELFSIDGKEMTARESVDLGWLGEMPRTLVLRVRDADNPLDRDSVQVRSSAGLFEPRDPGVTFEPDGLRAGTLTVSPPELPGMDAVTRAKVELVVDDYAIDTAQARRSVSWSLSPRIKLDDGTLLIVDSLTSSGGWQDWSVIADGVIMTDQDTTTAGKTWLSDNSEGEHWMVWRLPEERAVSGVKLAWPWYQQWRTSRNYDVQTWDGEAWVTQVEVRDQPEQQSSEHRFEAPVRTTGVRILQQPLGGQIGRQDLMWLAEADVLFAE